VKLAANGVREPADAAAVIQLWVNVVSRPSAQLRRCYARRLSMLRKLPSAPIPSIRPACREMRPRKNAWSTMALRLRPGRAEPRGYPRGRSHLQHQRFPALRSMPARSGRPAPRRNLIHLIRRRQRRLRQPPLRPQRHHLRHPPRRQRQRRLQTVPHLPPVEPGPPTARPDGAHPAEEPRRTAGANSRAASRITGCDFLFSSRL
jgi:hypothetical protein